MVWLAVIRHCILLFVRLLYFTHQPNRSTDRPIDSIVCMFLLIKPHSANENANRWIFNFYFSLSFGLRLARESEEELRMHSICLLLFAIGKRQPPEWFVWCDNANNKWRVAINMCQSGHYRFNSNLCAGNSQCFLCFCLCAIEEVRLVCSAWNCSNLCAAMEAGSCPFTFANWRTSLRIQGVLLVTRHRIRAAALMRSSRIVIDFQFGRTCDCAIKSIYCIDCFGCIDWQAIAVAAHSMIGYYRHSPILVQFPLCKATPPQTTYTSCRFIRHVK